MPGKVHTDDIPVPVQAPGSGKTRTGRLWVYVRDDRNAGSVMPPAVWFAYSPDRKGIHPQQHLAGYSGILQADAYGGYNALYENGRITEAACMAHARRKIHDVHVRTPTDITTEALRRIGELYAIEAEIRGSPAEKAAVGQKSEDGAADAIAVRLDPDTDENAVAPRGDGEGVRLSAETVECVDPLLRERLGGNRQQYRRERPARCRAGAQKLVVRRVRCRRRTCCDTVLADRHVQTQRRGAGEVAALRAQSYPGLAGESGARAAAVENRPHLCISVKTVQMRRLQFSSVADIVTLKTDTIPGSCGYNHSLGRINPAPRSAGVTER